MLTRREEREQAFILLFEKSFNAEVELAEVSGELLPFMLHGTGDLYASALLAALMAGQSLFDGVEFASHIVRDAMRITSDQPDYEVRGVSFETILGQVTALV
jgi:pyridoxine kinase